MKKAIFLFIALSACMHFSYAQATFGISAGATFAYYKVKSDEGSVTAKIRAGFTAGLLSSVSISKNFSFQPALNFVQKGGTLKDDGSNTTNKAHYYYLELPLNFVYNIQSAAGKFFIGAGPSLSYGLSGKYKITGMYEESGSIKFGSSEDDDLKPFEIGANMLAGYNFANGVFIAASYNLAISNISNDSEAKFHNKYFAIRLGYMFGNSK